MKKFQKSLNSLTEFLSREKCEKCGKQAVHIMPFTNPPHFFCDECMPFKAEKKQTEKNKKACLKNRQDKTTLAN